ncbi:hypothetical protein FC15_GL001030 [Lapidilactobacillus concavus DSM 17758]|uniref:Uncharacterized protein n=1 Tax=Lapidilactobacillus concavus DSM 17758 TaxID=1423735 RepID=A0A0R1WG29_9LACO|nr:phosphoglycerate mutase family protein [Lapidilactobacillus concavus]KRM13859.1 hypothetical protein FC15_GL001030 [Lapidilactobacillus concavus DSM 17758]GEL12745.1 hypothetical protein LCO01nite_02940 [Lapidilactobacillus concavus]
MATTIVYFVYGSTADNTAQLASGWHDVPLNSVGIAQAKQLGQTSIIQNFDVVFTSDLTRAV